MKKTVAYYLLLIYTVTICQPIFPWVQDLFAHTFYETEHIAMVHHQDGSNHVHAEVGKLVGSTNNNQSINNKTYSDVPLHTQVSDTWHFNVYTFSPDLIFYDSVDKLPLMFAGILIPPPKG